MGRAIDSPSFVTLGLPQTLTNNHGGDPWVADLFTLLGNPGVPYTNLDDDYLVVASLFETPLFEKDGPDSAYYSALDSKYTIGITRNPGSSCKSASTPARCQAQLRTPLCTRYTYAAVKQNYPMTYLNTLISGAVAETNGFLAMPTSPTTCFPVTEFDLSK